MITTKTFYVPHTTRRKYGDYPQTGTTINQASSSGGGGGGVGTTAYLTGWATSTADTANT